MFGQVRNALADYAVDPRIAFWRDQSKWPDDAPEFVFIARAILQLGRKRFGEAWSDDIPATSLTWELPEHLSIYTPIEDIRRAVRVLQDNCETYRARSGMSLLSSGVGPDFPTRTEWELAREIIARDSAAKWTKFRPYLKIAGELSNGFKTGIVSSATRGFLGGEPMGKEWHFWNIEHSWLRFDTCRVAEDEPFGPKHVAGSGLWLFADKKSFERLLEGSAAPAPEGFSDPVSAQTLTRGRPAGRSTRYNWDVLAGQFARMVHDEGIPQDGSNRQIARRLADWASENLDDAPEENTIRPKVAIWRAQVAGAG